MKDRPLEVEVVFQNLVYVSSAKMRDFGRSPEKRGWNIGLDLSLGLASIQKSERELLTEIGHLLQDQEILSYETSPRAREYFLVRARVAAGTMWPWSGSNDAMKQVVWWVGENTDVRILAYGNRKHLRQQGAQPENEIKGTWWPSIADGYYELLDSIVLAVSSESDESSLDIRSKKVSALMDFAFHDDLRRERYLQEPSICELLLRVDGVDHEPGEKPVVYGSPLWVARVPSK